MKTFLNIFFLLHLFVCQNVGASYGNEEREEEKVISLPFLQNAPDMTEDLFSLRKNNPSPKTTKRKKRGHNRSENISKRSKKKSTKAASLKTRESTPPLLEETDKESEANKKFSFEYILNQGKGTETQEALLNLSTSTNVPSLVEISPQTASSPVYVPPKPPVDVFSWSSESGEVKENKKKSRAQIRDFNTDWTKTTTVYLSKHMKKYIEKKELPPLEIRHNCAEKMNKEFKEEGRLFTQHTIATKIRRLMEEEPLPENLPLNESKKSIPRNQERNKLRPATSNWTQEAEDYLIALLKQFNCTIFSKNLNGDVFQYCADEMEKKFPGRSFKNAAVRGYVNLMKKSASSKK